MLTRRIARPFEWLRDRAAAGIASTGVPPNILTWYSLILNLWAGILFASGRFAAAGGVMIAAGFFNIVDGPVARKQKRVTVFGGFLDAILGDLRNAGFVFSKKGPGGGYMLARAPTDITVGHVIRTIDGPLAPIACASQTAYQPCRDCKSVKACTVRLMMSKVRDAMSEVLDRLTIADMAAMGDGSNIALLKRRQSRRPAS